VKEAQNEEEVLLLNPSANDVIEIPEE